MKNSYGFTVALLLLIATVCPGQAIETKLNNLLDHYHRNHGFSGVVLVGNEDSVIHLSAHGYANREHSILNNSNTVFRIASVTKQLTAAAILRLEQEGKLDLHTPISKYLPSLRPEIGEAITLHHLLSHSSGLARDIESLTTRDLGHSYISLGELISIIDSSDLVFKPGEKYSYSNLGYTLSAAIIESVTGKSYGEAMNTLVFDPLGMTNSAHEEAYRIVPNRAEGYVSLPDGETNAEHEDKSYVIGAGSIYSTVEDLFSWAKAVQSGPFLSGKNRELLLSKQAGRYSYGWFVDSYVWPPVNDENQGKNIHHSGGCPGFESKISLLLDHNWTIIVLSNSLPSGIGNLTNQITNLLVGFDEEPLPSNGSKELYKALFDDGIDAAISLATDWYNQEKRHLIPPLSDTLLIGRGYMDAHKYIEAHLFFDLLIKVRPKWSHPYLLKALSYEQTGETDKAVAIYKQILSFAPEDSNALNRLKILGVGFVSQ